MPVKLDLADSSVDLAPPSGPPFDCTVRAGDVRLVWVHVSGDLDISTAPRLARVLRHTHAWPLTILDLRDLSFLDSSGVHVIVDGSTRNRLRNRRFIVIGGSGQVDRILSLSGASNVLKTVDLDDSGGVTPRDGRRSAISAASRHLSAQHLGER